MPLTKQAICGASMDEFGQIAMRSRDIRATLDTRGGPTLVNAAYGSIDDPIRRLTDSGKPTEMILLKPFSPIVLLPASV